jgi:hypothetical protein
LLFQHGVSSLRPFLAKCFVPFGCHCFVDGCERLDGVVDASRLRLLLASNYFVSLL